MGFGHKRTDLQANAQRKFDDANILLNAGSFSNSYYLAGYSVEIGLKACIAAQMPVHTIPPKQIIHKVLRHEFPLLIGLAGLATALKEEQDRNAEFGAMWAICGEWSPDARYEASAAAAAQELLNAIGHPDSGVLRWIRNYW